MTLLTIAFTLTLAGLIWARYFFFVVRSNTVRSIGILYDALVACQIITTYFHLFVDEGTGIQIQVIGVVAYTIASLLFYWSILTAQKLDFAFSESVGTLITNGPFKIVRHPFYTSYIVIWATNTIIFSTPVLWISFLALLIFYYKSAIKEENLILRSIHAKEYANMRRNVGMFLPRVAQWKHWRLEKSAKSQR